MDVKFEVFRLRSSEEIILFIPGHLSESYHHTVYKTLLSGTIRPESAAARSASQGDGPPFLYRRKKAACSNHNVCMVDLPLPLPLPEAWVPDGALTIRMAYMNEDSTPVLNWAWLPYAGAF